MGRNDEMVFKAKKLRWLNNKRVVGREEGREGGRKAGSVLQSSRGWSWCFFQK